ncbi:hypothetical protein AVEN_117191-1 [Araneus ventricosus]|uniref:Uncharacterized protein n=1 Tax=Araneus ventricosus TaxID=182803 RepID=A0A4Y2AX57_ARAVE|nr:hypothetical protein AVEN_117191-1 [Araneus ventricosus]
MKHLSQFSSFASDVVGVTSLFILRKQTAKMRVKTSLGQSETFVSESKDYAEAEGIKDYKKAVGDKSWPLSEENARRRSLHKWKRHCQDISL